MYVCIGKFKNQIHYAAMIFQSMSLMYAGKWISSELAFLTMTKISRFWGTVCPR